MKKTTQERDPGAAKRLRTMIEDISVGMVTTATPDGKLRSRPMITAQASEDGELWFLTADDAGKVEDIEDEHAVNVSYADPKANRYVSVTGNATIVHDAAKVQALWDSKLARFFPRGPDDPHLALLRVQIDTAEYWDAKTGRMQRVDESGDGSAGAAAENAAGHTRVEIRATPTSG